MKAKKLTATQESFLCYSFHGNGKYYTAENGSRKYRNTYFENFKKNNSDCFKIISTGNDAPRGGMTGNYVIAIFNELFNEKFGWWFEKQKEIEAAAKKATEQKKETEKVITEKFTEYCKKHPENVNKWLLEIELLSSKRARLYKENRVARSVGNFDFWGKYRIFDEVIFNK